MRIEEWEWDDENVAHIARHGVEPSDIEQVWLDQPRFRRNKKGRAASHQMIGPDQGGRYVAAFIVPVAHWKGTWRVITARVATDAERQWWEKS